MLKSRGGREEEDRETSPPRPVPLWRNRDYVLRWSGQTVSTLGTQISQIAFPLLVLSLTRSPAQAGIIAGLRVVPYLLLSLPAGALVDRWNRKRTMILCDLGRGLLMASIPAALAAGSLSIVQLYLVSVIDGTLYVFFSLALTASLPRIIPKEQLAAAMAQNEGVLQLTSLLGPLLGGVLYGLGRLVPFLTDAVSYLASVLSLSFMRAEFQEERTAPPRRLRTEIGEGLAWLWNQPLVRAMGFLSAVTWIMLAPINLVVIVLARHQHDRPATIGLILAVGGIGGLVGSILAGVAQRRFSFGQIIVASAWLWAAIWPLYALAPNPFALGAVTAALFTVWPLYNVTQMSYRLALIPDALQGRVNSVFRLIAFSGQPVGYALAGLLLQFLGPVSTVLVLGTAPLFMALMASANRHVRAAPALRDAHLL